MIAALLVGAVLVVLVARVTYLLCTYALYPSSVPDSSRLPPYKQHEVAGTNVRLLRGTSTHGGGLREPGWARSLVFAYSRSQARLWAPLVKEWDYYACVDNEVAVCLTVADLGYVATLSASVLVGFNRGRGNVAEYTDTLLVPLVFGRWRLPTTTERGTTHGRVGNAHMTFTVSDSDDGTERVRTLEVDWPEFARKAPDSFKAVAGVGLKAVLTLRERLGSDSIVVATPFGRNDHLWYLNQKINCQRVAGTATVGQLEHVFCPDKAFAVLDWGRGLWPYSSSWVWASASGRARIVQQQQQHHGKEGEGKEVVFGLNFGHGFGNCATHTENCVFVDGVMTKLGRMVISFDKNNFGAAPWHFRDEEDKVDLTMEPLHDRYAPVDAAVVSMIAHQVFGVYSGTVLTDSGDTIAVDNLVGWAEFVANRW